ncbi:hypothetical protein PILCRDRAFT_12292 [Piloderma croceum F 1598]|uniref:Uncharacterized protein n=1 Tax=Piloderma croceum (strain F 1598) TaxID=765440 RepID=A0A0C3FBA1_PILCF|nr:hypothetical protein PILCRDRAFT_12292 [Piloderma croceum F 1598]
MADLWESITEYSNAQKTYGDFVKAVQGLYPGVEEERKWSIADMDKLVGERSCLGVLSLGDLDNPYDLSKIHKAVQFVLHGMPSNLLTPPSPPIPSAGSTITSMSTSSNKIKVEDIAAMIKHITESFVKALSAQGACSSSSGDRLPQPVNPNPTSGCNYCRSLEHFIHNCLIILEDIKQGRCKRNIKGKVTLPTSAFIPRDIPGNCLKDCIKEWHCCNPRQLAAAQMLYHVLSNGISDTSGTSQLKVKAVPTLIASCNSP